MIETGRIINGDCIEVMKTLPEGCIDLVVTSPPYGVGIDYDVHENSKQSEVLSKFKEKLHELKLIKNEIGSSDQGKLRCVNLNNFTKIQRT